MGSDEGQKPERSKERKASGRRTPPTNPAGASPLQFWRRGEPRTYREKRPETGRSGSWTKRFPMPPWAPVVIVMLLVFCILAGVFICRGSLGQPQVGDHWHSSIRFIVFGEQSADMPEFAAEPEGIHTHGDGIIHSHPFIREGVGEGASIHKFVEYASQAFGTGLLTDDTLQVPNEEMIWKNGDIGPEGDPGVVQILVSKSNVDPDITGYDEFKKLCEKLPSTEYEVVSPRYIPEHGDCLIVMFGPQGELSPGSSSTPIP